MKTLRPIALAMAALLLLAGCSPVTATPWTAGSGKIKIVASTDVWGSVANLVAADLATVNAIIYNRNQDPHSYELTARDQLLINSADIVIMNGGGYDDFMIKAVEADPTPAITVDAFMASGDDMSRNEHVWYDVDQVGDVAAVIGAAIEAIDESKFDVIEANVDEFRKKISERKARLDSLRTNPKKVFLTEPLIAYLVEDAGFENLTPVAFSNAVEEERDVPPNEMKKAIELIKSGEVDFIALNDTTQTAQINSLLNANSKVPNFSFSELLKQDSITAEYRGDYFSMLDDSIASIGENN